MPKHRSPVLGYNHNIRHKGWVFHVQTEDSGVQNPHVFTHLFHEGVIISSKKLEYDPMSDEDIVKTLMQAQHKATMKELRHGIFDAKIDKYLGPSPEASGEQQAIPEVMAEEAAATIPNMPPIEVEMSEADASTSAPYSQLVLEDAIQSVVSGTLNVKSEPVEQPPVTAAAAPLLDGDDEINGLLNRLREETPPPELITDGVDADAGVSTTPVQSAEESHPGAWIQARPGQKERPFDRTESVPIPIRDDVARRVMTPPVLPIVDPPQPPRNAGPPVKPATPPPIPAGAPRRPSAPVPKVQPPPLPRAAAPPPPPMMPSGGARTSPLPVLPRSSHSGTAPVVPRAAATSSVSPPVPPRSSASVQARAITPPPGRLPVTRAPGSSTPPPRTQPPPPVLPRSQPLAPLGARPGARAATPLPVRSGPLAGGPRRSITGGESVVVARPAVVIGAPPTVIGGPGDHSARSRTPHHGRESNAAGQSGENIFGQDLISEKSLDEVIMAYLSEESTDD